MTENYDETISALWEEIRILREELAQMRELLREKDAVIAKLKEELRKNSQNSSKPPSSDGYRKPCPGKDGTESRSATGTSGTRIENAQGRCD